MNARIIYIAFILIRAYSSYSQINSTDNSVNKIHCSLEVAAKDLSEDGTLMSSKNDELLILIYEKTDTSLVLNAPVFVSSFTLDTSTLVERFKSLTFSKREYILFLLELDDDRSVKQIDPVVRVYSDEIFRLFDQNKFSALTEYLGDNDLLGYYKLNVEQQRIPFEFEIKGRQALDSFDYKMKFY